MSDIQIFKINEAECYIKADESIILDIVDFFKFRPPGFQFMPKFKERLWDGYVRLFTADKRILMFGLIEHLLEFADNQNYTFEADFVINKNEIHSLKELERFSDSLELQSDNENITPYDFQLSALWEAVNNERITIQSPTASGKSLIIYMIIRWYQNQLDNSKTLLIVPTTSLVEQMYTDFEDYSTKNGWCTEEECHRIYGGKEKDTEKNVVISTWQSIYKKPKSWFSQFKVVLGDECHEFKAASLSNIMMKCTEAPYRFGLTGTLDNSKVHRLQLQGLFGKNRQVATIDDLMKKEILASLYLRCIGLVYNEENRKEVAKMTYQEEKDWLIDNPKRNQFIANLTNSLLKKKHSNTLILYNNIRHGEELYQRIVDLIGEERVHLLSGKDKTEERERVRLLLKEDLNSVVIASYGIFSRGINIKNLFNVIFASPSKSEIRVLQSIGRGLRKSLIMNRVVLYDIFDDLRRKSRQNYSLKHFLERFKIYSREHFEYMIKKIDLR